MTEDDDDPLLAIWAREFELPTTYRPEEQTDYEEVDENVDSTSGLSDDDILQAVRVEKEETVTRK